MINTGNFERFHYLNFETTFMKSDNFFLKNWRTVCEFESTTTENTTFPCKTTTSKSNVKTNRMMSTISPITKSGVLPPNYLSFWKIHIYVCMHIIVALMYHPPKPYLYFS